MRIHEENINLIEPVEIFCKEYEQYVDLNIRVQSFAIDINQTLNGIEEKVVYVNWELYTDSGKWVNKHKFSNCMSYLDEKAQEIATRDAHYAYSCIVDQPEHDYA